MLRDSAEDMSSDRVPSNPLEVKSKVCKLFKDHRFSGKDPVNSLCERSLKNIK